MNAQTPRGSGPETEAVEARLTAHAQAAGFGPAARVAWRGKAGSSPEGYVLSTPMREIYLGTTEYEASCNIENAQLKRGPFAEAPEGSKRPLSVIALEIRRLWAKPYFGAVPYLDAMRSLDSCRDNYGADSGKSIVLYFLANAATWRGPDAKRIKAELKAHTK